MSKKTFEDPSELIEKYNSGISTMKLAKEYNTSHTVIGGTLKRAGVKIRSLKEAHEFRDISGDKNPNYGGGCFGENNGNWQGGREKRTLKGGHSKEMKEWRIKVKERDCFTCQLCNSKNKHNLISHHIINWIKNDELRFEQSNGITLCNSCHGRVSRNEEKYIKLFREIIKINISMQ